MSSPVNNTHMFSLVVLCKTQKEAFLVQTTLHHHGCILLVQVCRASSFRPQVKMTRSPLRSTIWPATISNAPNFHSASRASSDTAALPLPSRNICPLSSSPPMILQSSLRRTLKREYARENSSVRGIPPTFAVLPCPPYACPACHRDRFLQWFPICIRASGHHLVFPHPTLDRPMGWIRVPTACQSNIGPQSPMRLSRSVSWCATSALARGAA